MLIILEIAAVLLILLYLYYAGKTNPLAWLFGILASVCSVVLFYKQSLYGSAVLNIIYGIQGFIGYRKWKFLQPNKTPAYNWTVKHHIVLILLCVLSSIFLYKGFRNSESFQLVYWDLLLALFSISATYLEINKDIACWWYWIISNLAYAILYSFQGQAMLFYAALMVGLAVFSWFAMKSWENKLRYSKQEPNT